MPNALVATVSVMLYNSLGVSNEATAFFTSLLYLPWVIKPLWSPVVDILKTRRLWIWTMQLLLGIGLAGVSLMIPAPHFVRWTIVFFGLLAFSSATHDIAADGFTCWRRRSASSRFSWAFAACFSTPAKFSRRARWCFWRAGWKNTPAIPRLRGQRHSRSRPEFFCASVFITIVFCRGQQLISQKGPAFPGIFSPNF